jgi:hypothetical protein
MHTANLFLASLSTGDAAALVPHLQPVHLEHQFVLSEAGDRIKAVRFPTGAIISLVVGLSTGEMVEAAMVGRDGVWGHRAERISARASVARPRGKASDVFRTSRIGRAKACARLVATMPYQRRRPFSPGADGTKPYISKVGPNGAKSAASA